MAELADEKPVVRVSYDEMEAYMTLVSPQEDKEYTVSQVMQELADKGITTGINKEKIEQMIENKVYDNEILVAQGTSAQDGIDGSYEYNFDANFDGKPKILPDGSVDYWSVHSIESVLEGQVIAVYTPAVTGVDGVTTKGKPISAKKGRDLLPLKGKGFERKEDNVTYVATIDGKIEMQNDRIVILPIHEMQGNAELSTGNIDFRGDVVIHGNVESGLKIKATGSITIDGIVESCDLEAGKEIILRSGMLGAGKSTVKCKGNITAKFFEFTKIECEGDIRADVLMECDVTCQGKIMVSGSRGKIIGGEVRASKGVDVTTLGNNAEKRTSIYVGAGLEVYSRLRILEKKILATKQSLIKVEDGLKQFDILEKERGVSYANDPRRMSLLRLKIKDTAALANDEAELKKLKILADESKGARVSVLKEVYPGVVINIDEMRFTLKNVGTGVEFYKLEDKIATGPCYRDVE